MLLECGARQQYATFSEVQLRFARRVVLPAPNRLSHRPMTGPCSAGEKEYYLASVFSEIYAPPSASLSLRGMSVAGTFLRGALEKVRAQGRACLHSRSLVGQAWRGAYWADG